MRSGWLPNPAGYHFSYQGSEWICSRSGKELMALVREECSNQSDEEIEWS